MFNKKDKLNIGEFINKSKWPILIIILFLTLCFGQRLLSNSFSMDTEFYINHYRIDWNWWLGLNRWGLVFINNILQIGPLVLFQANFMTFVFIMTYSILVCYLFYLYIPEKWEKNYLKFQFILPIIFITSPIFAEQYNFVNQNAAVSLGINLVIISLILWNLAIKKEGNIKHIYNIGGIVLATLAFGIYQSMIPLAILLIASTYFLECIRKKDNCFKFLINNIVKFAIVCGCYLLISKIFGGENSYLQSGWSTNGLKCFEYIYEAIVNVFKCDTIFYNVSYLIALGMIVGINIYYFIKKQNNFGIVLSSIGLALSPFYIMFITGVDQLKRTQFNYSLVIGFIFLVTCILLFNYKKTKFFACIIVMLSLAVAYKQATITSTLFYSDNVRFEYDTMFANKIQSRIEQKEWYDSTKEYTLVILGKKTSEAVNLYEKGEVIGNSFFEFDYQYIYGPTQRANAFMKTLGYNYKEPTYKEFDLVKEYALENEIESFPKDESIVIMNEDVIIVRLSEEL